MARDRALRAALCYLSGDSPFGRPVAVIPCCAPDPSSPSGPFLQLTGDDLIAGAVFLAPAVALYARGLHLAGAAAGGVGLLAAVPLILWPPVDGRRGYARVMAWAMWLFEPRSFVPMAPREVKADGARQRHRLFSRRAARARG